MKPYTLLTAITICLLTMLASCDKLPDNGKLDGMWQLMSVENNDGQTIDTKDLQKYWSFRLRLVQFSTTRNKSSIRYYAHFRHDGNIITMSDFCDEARYETETDDNEWIGTDESNKLIPWGLYLKADEADPNKTMATFIVEELSSERLVVTDGQHRLTLRKF